VTKRVVGGADVDAEGVEGADGAREGATGVGEGFLGVVTAVVEHAVVGAAVDRADEEAHDVGQPAGELVEDADDVIDVGDHEQPAIRGVVGLADGLGGGVEVVADGGGHRVSPGESEELKRLRRENAELKRANDILKAASAFFAAEIDRPQRRS